VTIYGPSSIVTASDKIKVGRSHIYANSVTSFKGYIDAVASSSSTSVAGLSASGEFVVNGAAQISASASVTPSAIIKHGGSCAITASATTAIAGLIVKDANITVNAEVLVSPSANATLVNSSIFDQYANISSGSAVEYVSSAIIETLCIITPNGRLKWEQAFDTQEIWTEIVSNRPELESAA